MVVHMYMTQVEQKLQYGNIMINYTIIKTSRRKKRSEIIIKRDGKVTVRAPFDKPISYI